MCGIYGIAKSPTPYTKKQLKLVRRVLREMATDSETRGTHSSGIASVGNNVNIYKSLLPSSKFVDSKNYNKAVKSLGDDTTILMGHTRFATAGEITISNAHPFKVGNTVGAHNGCVYNQAEMEVKLDKECQVDSQLFFKAIDNASGIQDAVKHFDSDFALSFIKDDKTILHLCREENRPLHFTYVKKLKTLFYASESDFISDAFDKYGMDVDVSQLNKNILYSFDTLKFSDEKTNVMKTKFEYDSRVYTNWIGNNYQNKNYQTDSEWESQPSGYHKYLDDDGFRVEDQPDYDDNGQVSGEWLENTKERLASLYGTYSWMWFFDETLQQWFYADNETGDVLSEDQFVELYYGMTRDNEDKDDTETQFNIKYGG